MMHKWVLDRRGVGVAVTCLSVLVAAVAYAQEEVDKQPAAENDKQPAAENVQKAPKAHKPMSADKIRALLEQGIQKSTKSKSKSKAPPKKSNRVWTVGELIAKFGEPTSRKGGGARSKGDNWSAPGNTVETWTWERDGGSVVAKFSDMGYGSPDSAKSLRLKIGSVSIERPK